MVDKVEDECFPPRQALADVFEFYLKKRVKVGK